jgi:hypothetical protein
MIYGGVLDCHVCYHTPSRAIDVLKGKVLCFERIIDSRTLLDLLTAVHEAVTEESSALDLSDTREREVTATSEC